MKREGSTNLPTSKEAVKAMIEKRILFGSGSGW